VVVRFVLFPSHCIGLERASKFSHNFNCLHDPILDSHQFQLEMMVHNKLLLILLPFLIVSFITADPGTIRGLLEEQGEVKKVGAPDGVDHRDLARRAWRKWHGHGRNDRDLGMKGFRNWHGHGKNDRHLGRRGLWRTWWKWW
jgi:hypothetical protein